MISRRLLLFISLAVAESSWLFVVASAIGLVFGGGESPLPWLVILFVLAIAMAVTWVAAGLGGDFLTLAFLQGGLSLVVIYGATALRMTDEASGWDGLWFGRLLSGDFSQQEIATSITAFVIAVFLWLRGMKFVAAGEPWEALHRTFRIGVAAIALGLIVELIRDEDVGITLVIFPFFAASLAGMAIGRLAEEGAWNSGQRIWGRVIAGSVGSVLGAGVALGALGAAYGEGPLGLIISGAAAIRDGALKVAEVILTLPLTALFWLVEWLRDRFGDGAQRGQLIGNLAPPDVVEQAEKAVSMDTGDSLIENIVQILVWPLGFIVLLVVLWIMVKSFQRIRNRVDTETSADRESIRGNASARRDLGDLLSRLIPGFLNRSSGSQEGLRYPVNEPGVTEVFRLYFRYLSAASQSGAVLESHLTPAELEGRLQAALPGAPVGPLTRRFEAACYGREPTGADTLQRLGAWLSGRDAGTDQA